MAEITLTLELKTSIYQQLKEGKFIDYVVGYGDFMDILSSLWNVFAKPIVSDNRFKSFGDEIVQHYINNNDWSTDSLFISHLKIFEDDERFKGFVIRILNQCNTGDLTQQAKVKELILWLNKQHIDIATKERDGKKLFTGFVSVTGVYSGVVENKIPIYVVPAGGHTEYASFQATPPIFPSYQLVFDSGWNDYGYNTRFVLYYYQSNKEAVRLGDVRILKGNSDNTFKEIDKEFTMIGNDCCSLGYDSEYYENLHNRLGDSAWSLLYALNDVACFPLLRNRFENNPIYNTSLLRDEGRDMLEDGLYIVSGRDMAHSFSFEYKFKPEYSDESCNMKFSFSSKKGNEYRKIYGIIGENGVGKTTFLRNLLVDLYKKNKGNFNGELPIYSKIVSVSFSPFDIFVDIKPSPWFNYIYCGLMNSEGNVMKKNELCHFINDSFRAINKRSLGNDWWNVMSEIFCLEDLKSLSSFDDNERVIIRENLTEEELRKISSGQRTMLLTMSSIIANISSHSLLLIDEPEQHMHPNGITAIMRSLFPLVRRFNSYAIITTHSPLVIRELVGDRVYIMRRDGDYLDISKIPIESFGEDVSVLIDRIFGNYDQKKKFVEFINRWASEKDATFDSVIKKIERNDLRLSLNAKLYIREAFIEKEVRDAQS